MKRRPTSGHKTVATFLGRLCHRIQSFFDVRDANGYRGTEAVFDAPFAVAISHGLRFIFNNSSASRRRSWASSQS